MGMGMGMSVGMGITLSSFHPIRIGTEPASAAAAAVLRSTAVDGERVGAYGLEWYLCIFRT